MNVSSQEILMILFTVHSP